MKPFYQIPLLPSEKRPRERLMSEGPDVLNSAELLAIVLNTGYGKENVLELANRILQEYGSKAIINEKQVNRLMRELGLPPVKACQIIACFELGRRFFQEDKGNLPTLRNPEDVCRYLSDMKKLKKEHFRGLYLNIRHKLIHDEVVAIGTLEANLIHPREVFQPAVNYSAAAVILAHNHPSGDPTPSPEDKEITKRLVAAGELLNIKVLDHLIIAEQGFKSVF